MHERPQVLTLRRTAPPERSRLLGTAQERQTDRPAVVQHRPDPHLTGLEPADVTGTVDALHHTGRGRAVLVGGGVVRGPAVLGPLEHRLPEAELADEGVAEGPDLSRVGGQRRSDQRERRPLRHGTAEGLGLADHPRENRTVDEHPIAAGRAHRVQTVRVRLDLDGEGPLRHGSVRDPAAGAVVAERHSDRPVSAHDRRGSHRAGLERRPAGLVCQPAQRDGPARRERLPPATVGQVGRPGVPVVRVERDHGRRRHHRLVVPEAHQCLLAVVRDAAGTPHGAGLAGQHDHRVRITGRHQVPERPQVLQHTGEHLAAHRDRAAVGQLQAHAVGISVRHHVRRPLRPRRGLRGVPALPHVAPDLVAVVALRQQQRRAAVRQRERHRVVAHLPPDRERHRQRAAVRTVERGDPHLARAELRRQSPARGEQRPVLDHVRQRERLP